ncbi:TPA: hypothetical protein ACP3ZG_001649 [Pseudomonas aeruginosa]|uniref:hypothetical protein n=2 Tax=Pseudomonas TaxID=286 RepID=UPI00117AEBD9|nr:hypothetical protein [Pseudomonas aeruginosa]ELH1095503.1 hypothetical protein [Pseudomonas aeruginosa]ELL4401189.1 hypothetical protein [Pseudomonas aeruginosa]MBH4095012.1 hypothetical protein [Pseudomonas aeruginosa]MBI8852466.1 hypothetical protein [Pseudomonas aeruginosa]HDU2622363.1 hypothetical protein [Pseudomonas aeruginosa]
MNSYFGFALELASHEVLDAQAYSRRKIRAPSGHSVIASQAGMATGKKCFGALALCSGLQGGLAGTVDTPAPTLGHFKRQPDDFRVTIVVDPDSH